MSYNFIYIINNKTSSSELYKSLEECYLAQNKFIGSKEIAGSVNSVQVQSCSNYNDEDAAAAPIYNFNANASPNTVQKLDSVPGAVIYTMLEPINGNNKIDATDTTFSTYIQSTFNIIIGVLIVIGVFRIMYGGTIFLTTDVIMGKMKGKEVIIGSLKGVILALFTWSILSLINPDILNNNISKVVGGGVGGVFKELGKVVGVGTTPTVINTGSGPELLAKILADEPAVRSKLENGGININNSACTVVGSSGCTSVGLINDSVINKIISLETECKVLKSSCEVTVTGGTEWWAHGRGVRDPSVNTSNHVPGKGKQGIDLSITDSLISFLKAKGIDMGGDSGCYSKYQYAGAIYCDEINTARHFHVNY